MDRRSFLGVAAGALSLTQMPAPARANLEGKKGLRLSITWGMLGRMPVPEALALLSRLGYDAYEMFDWRSPETLQTFVGEKGKSPLFCACLVANKGVAAPGCGLSEPSRARGFPSRTRGVDRGGENNGLQAISGSDRKRAGRNAARRADGQRGGGAA